MNDERVAALAKDLREANLKVRVLGFLKRRLPKRLYEELRDELQEKAKKKRDMERPPVGGWVWNC